MKRFLPVLCSALCFLVLLPEHASAQAYNQVTSPRRGKNGRKATPAPAPNAAQPNASPSATPVPVQAPSVILSVTANTITVARGETKMTSTYKVTQYSQVTLNGQIAQFSALKPGMLAVITPNDDQIYADAVAASDPPPAPPAPPADSGTAAAPAATPAPAASATPAPEATPAPKPPPMEQPTY